MDWDCDHMTNRFQKFAFSNLSTLESVFFNCVDSALVDSQNIKIPIYLH